ncbi:MULTISPECIES: VOC family protein [Mycolicibacterium]|uniref:VOC family protein n=1 Tax=Mycolicibacterium TaxID=1866885 RepID=UPI00148FF87E|nr:VOC family protein [Mycolicibacterium fortuitum]
MTESRIYPPGVPCWVDTDQQDVAAAQDFYGRLFGWAFEDVLPEDAEDSYLIATLEGQDVAAIASAQSGDEIVWNTYVAVADADSTAAAVTDSGGTVITGPVDAGPGGRQAGCVDPRGAHFKLWQPRRRLGAQLVNVPGSWNFSNLQTSDPQAAASFYESLFGWEFDGAGAATMIRRPGYGDHLAATVDPDIKNRHAAGGTPPGFSDAIGWTGQLKDEQQQEHWQVVFAVASRDDSAELAEKLGAAVVSTADTEWTNTALIQDPQGARLVLSQFTPPAG